MSPGHLNATMSGRDRLFLGPFFGDSDPRAARASRREPVFGPADEGRMEFLMGPESSRPAAGLERRVLRTGPDGAVACLLSARRRAKLSGRPRLGEEPSPRPSL